METESTTGYSSRFLSLAYALASPLYDLIVWWGFLPLGGAIRSPRIGRTPNQLHGSVISSSSRRCSPSICEGSICSAAYTR